MKSETSQNDFSHPTSKSLADFLKLLSLLVSMTLTYLGIQDNTLQGGSQVEDNPVGGR